MFNLIIMSMIYVCKKLHYIAIQESNYLLIVLKYAGIKQERD
jgi:hypothetical protein